MKGQKLWAMLGGIAVASGCLSTMAIAKDDKTTVSQHPFNEFDAGKSKRGVRLDELFESLRKQHAAGPTAVKQPAKTAPVTTKAAIHVVSKATPKKQTVIATQKHTHVKNPRATSIQTALFNPASNGTSSVTTVSTGGSVQTPIISAWLDKPGAIPKYKPGERMVVKLSAASDCNVLVFDYDSKGTLTQLFPNEYETSGTLKAGQTVEIGGGDSKYTLDVAGKGMERIFVYAYPLSEQPITVAMSPIANTPFRSVAVTPDQYKRLVNESRIYFEKPGRDRSVKITPKSGAQAVSTSSVENDKQPNKLELTFQVDAK